MGKHSTIKDIKTWAKEYIETGATQTEIARNHGVSYATISHNFKTALPMIDKDLYDKVMAEKKERNKKTYHIPKENYIAIAQMYSKHTEITYSDIADYFDIAVSTVARIIRFGIKEIDMELWQQCLNKRKTRWYNPPKTI